MPSNPRDQTSERAGVYASAPRHFPPSTGGAEIHGDFSENGYFAIEQAVLDRRAPASCGGRWLDEDVMDTIYTLLITGGRTRISDGVDRATAPATRTFPYLAPPGAQP